MKNLSDVVIVNMSNMNLHLDIFKTQEYQDVEYKYIVNWYARLEKRKEIHFMRLCKLYYMYRLLDFENSEVYTHVNLSNLPYWKLVQWAACEMSFGYHHSGESSVERIVERIRMELPFEHVNGRSLEYTVEKFENALVEHCLNMKGTVHDWHKVLQHVPHKILTCEEFFG